MNEKTTSLVTITTVLLRSFRIGSGTHQSAIADACGKTKATWGKVETGKANLTLNYLYRASEKLQVKPWALLQLADKYAEFLKEVGWHITMGELHEGDDYLLEQANTYFIRYPQGRNKDEYRDFSIGPEPDMTDLFDTGKGVRYCLVDVFAFALGLEGKIYYK